MAVLKGVAAHYVMQAEDRVPIQVRQRELLAELVALLAHRGPAALERPFADDWETAGDDGARLRVVIDQVASLTDASAVALHGRLLASRA
jgi:dGTPase